MSLLFFIDLKFSLLNYRLHHDNNTYSHMYVWLDVYICICVYGGLVTKWCPILLIPMNYITCQAPLSLGLSRQEYWSGLPFPSPRVLPDSGIKTGSPALQADPLPTKPSGKPISVQFSSVAQSCPTLCDPINCSMPGLPVHHQLSESIQSQRNANQNHEMATSYPLG